MRLCRYNVEFFYNGVTNKMATKHKNAIYAQSGGVTSVINATASGLFTAHKNSENAGIIYAGINGIKGILEENLVDTSSYDADFLAKLKHTPGGFFGSSRYKLPDFDADPTPYERLFEVFAAYDIGYFFYNGGNDSADTCLKIGLAAEQLGYDLQAIHLPKTVDNDLPITDFCPGFGSVAKYIAVTARETALDIASMYATSTKVFVLEVMGRNAGWIAASAGLAKTQNSPAPQIILLPEVPFNRENFITKVQQTIADDGYAVVVASEGIKYSDGTFLSESSQKDAFGHGQLGGVAPKLAAIISEDTGLKNHWAVADYMQRSARHLASQIDVDAAFNSGVAGYEFAREGKTQVMPALIRENTLFGIPNWRIEEASLDKIANVEKKMPLNFISDDDMGITQEAIAYLQPLIEGEAYPPYTNGMPDYLDEKLVAVTKKLPEFKS